MPGFIWNQEWRSESSSRTSVKDEKRFRFPRRITVNYEMLRYFHERAEKRREILSRDTSFIYAHMKHVRAYFLYVNMRGIITFCIALSFIPSVHCQKNRKDEDKKDEEFRCPEGQGNGNFADPATCRRFYQVIHVIDLSGNHYISHTTLIIFITGHITLDYLPL